MTLPPLARSVRPEPYGGQLALPLLPAALLLVLASSAVRAAPANAPRITYFSVVRTGPTWVALEWSAESAQTFSLRYRPARGKWSAVEGIEGFAYSIAGLAPDQQYQFRLVARSADASRRPSEALSAVISTRTSPIETIAWEGLSLWPQWHLRRAPVAGLEPPPPPTSDGAAIETHGDFVYVLEAAGPHLLLSRLNPAACDRLDATMLAQSQATAELSAQLALPSPGQSRPVAGELTADWTIAITPPLDEAQTWCSAPDTCIQGDRLWFTWQASPPPGMVPAVSSQRQRLAFFDLSGDVTSMSPDQAAARLSSPLQIVPTDSAIPSDETREPETLPAEPPSLALRGTLGGHLALHRNALWIAWNEAWETGAGVRRGRLLLAWYDPSTGSLRDPVVWAGCPSADPVTPSIGRLDADLQVLFADAAAEEHTPGLAPLMSARFDGRRFYDVRVLRRMGRSLSPRGLQVTDRYYFTYQTDASYQVGGGAYSDIALGWMPSGALGLLGTIEGTGDAQPYATDMKRNTLPDLALLSAAEHRLERLYVCYSKDDLPPGAAVGTYIGRVTHASAGTGD